MAQENEQISPVDGWFNAYRVSASQDLQKKPSKQFYFVESTAPINVDTNNNTEQGTGKIRLTQGITSQIFDEIATALKKDSTSRKKKSDLVILVHGFNNPRETLLRDLFAEAYEAMSDPAISQGNSICIGYRWPSERIGAPLNSLFSAAPLTLLAFLLLGPALLLWSLFTGVSLLSWLGMFLLGTAIAAFTLRGIVYYRDQYRATHYGAPDLVELVRDLDNRLVQLGVHNNQIGLSFVAHSMGGYVVTNAVRILTDLFTPAAIAARHGLTEGGNHSSGELGKLGQAFKLGRLVLVSPDIPAEVLISTRANVLASSLKRFPEAYLFSNEGDEILRMISTLANYFSFPTTDRKHGYRLGNISIIPVGVPAVSIDGVVHDNRIRVGFSTLEQLEASLVNKGEKIDHTFPGLISYFDCTYFKDGSNPTLTGDRSLSAKTIPLLGHVFIFFGYILGKFDVHGGYFKTPFLRNLIFRLANLGLETSQAAFMKEVNRGIVELCESKQVKVLPKARQTNV